MQDLAYVLPRISVLGTWMNKARRMHVYVPKTYNATVNEFPR
jgi:hypothetical protein